MWSPFRAQASMKGGVRQQLLIMKENILQVMTMLFCQS